MGDTAVVCGIRAEILLRRDVPSYRPNSPTEVADLGLLVPNIELDTGCTPTNIPGSPPSSFAQTFTSRLLSLLCSTGVVRAEDLRILYQPPRDPDAPDKEPEEVVVGWWVLHMSVVFISLSGNASAFDAAWGAMMAALGHVRLPSAAWDPDLDGMVCDDAMETAKSLRVRELVFAATVGVVRGKQGQSWVLADMDAFEEGVDQAPEWVTMVGTGDRIKRIEMWTGGLAQVGKSGMGEMLRLASARWKQWARAMENQTTNEES
jgi:exosome complex component RRP43